MCFKRFLLKSNTKVAVEVEIVDTTHNLRKYIALSGHIITKTKCDLI